MDRLKLIKFLNLSSSANDSESLSAIKKANLYLKENNSSWSELLKESVIKEAKDDYVILHRELLKERAYSQQLLDENKFSVKVIKYLLLIIVILILLLIYVKF